MVGVFSQVPSYMFCRAWTCCSSRGKLPRRQPVHRARLACAAYPFAAIEDVRLDYWRLVHSQHLVIVEVTLRDRAALDRDVAV